MKRATTGWRRWLKRSLWAAAVIAVVVAGGFLFLPIPIGWAINYAAKQAAPPEISARVASATFRWRAGNDTARVEVVGLGATVKGQPLATVDRVVVEIDKAAARHGFYAPRIVTVSAPRLIVDTTAQGAFTTLSKITTPAAAPKATVPAAPSPGLLALAPALPPPGGASLVRIDGVRVDYIFQQAQWSVRGGVEARLTRTGDDLRVTMETKLGLPEHPIASRIEAEVGLRSGKVRASVTVPEFRTSELAALSKEALPIEGTVALAGGAEFDAIGQRLLAANVDFSFRDGKLTLPGVAGPPIAVERIAIRGKATPRGTGTDAVLWGELEQGVVVIDGARIDIRQFEGALAERTRLSWAAEISNLMGARLAPRLPEAVSSSVPWIATALAASSVARIESKGTATIERDGAGTLLPRDVEAAQKVELKVADESLTIDLAVRQREAAPIEATLKLAPFEPRKMARAFPAEWPLASAAFPVGVEALAHASPAGELLDADARVAIGRGEWRGLPALPLVVPIRSVALEAKVREKGTRLEVPALTIETTLGNLTARNVVAVHTPPSARASGQVEVTGVELASLAALVPPDAMAALKDAGLTLADFALRRMGSDFSVELAAKTGVDWQPTKADAAVDVEAGFAGKPIVLRVVAKLPERANEATAQLSVREFRPSDFGPRVVAGANLADFKFPVLVEGQARLLVAEQKLKSATVRARVGAGEATVAAMSATMPFRGATAEAEYFPDDNVVRVSTAGIDLANGLQAGVERVTVTLGPKMRIEGRAKMAPLSLLDALAWWPAGLLADVRKQVVEAQPVGKFQTEGIDFEIAAQGDKGALVPTKARGTVAFSEWSGRAPGVPGSVGGDEARVVLDYPRADVTLKNFRATGLVVETASATIADVMAARPMATARASFTLDAGAAEKWIAAMPASAAMMSAAKSSGRVRGEFSASGAIDANDFSGAKATLTMASEKLNVPEMFDGPLQAKIDLAAPTRTTLSAGVVVTLAEAKVLGLERKVGGSPLTLAVTLHDWTSSETPVADVSLVAADFGGVPLRLNASARMADRGQSVKQAELKELVFGRTELRGSWRRESATHDSIALSGARVDVDELLRVAAPWMAVLPPSMPTAPPVAPAANPSATAAVATVPARPTTIAATASSLELPKRAAAPLVRLDAKLDIGEIAFGSGRRLRGVSAETELEDDWPKSVRFSATEGDGNRTSFTLTPPASGQQHLSLAVADLAGFARTLTEPLRLTPLPPGPLAETVKSFAGIPALVAGGAVTIEGDLARVAGGISAKGNFQLRDTTMIRPPRVLQLLALKSKKTLERSPLIRRLAVDEWSIDPESVAVRSFALEGSGLIDRVKLNAVRYTFAGEKILVDGDYFGVGFEVIGTRADPQVFLKENAVIRTIGQKNEFDFFGEEAAPPPPKKK